MWTDYNVLLHLWWWDIISPLDYAISVHCKLSRLTDRLCKALTTHHSLSVILCLPEKGRREIEEIVEEMKERDRGEKKINEMEETKKL